MELSVFSVNCYFFRSCSLQSSYGKAQEVNHVLVLFGVIWYGVLWCGVEWFGVI